MPPIESPLNAAHQHAANADDYMAQGLLIPAAEENYKAAAAFEAAYQASSDEHAKRTLQLLYAKHTKTGKEIQRRIEKLKAENKDPSLPQKPFRLTQNGHSGTSSHSAPQPVPSPPLNSSLNRLSESQQGVDESFMLLGQKSEPGDAFNHFWKITEGMLDYLSQPVAFATAPLTPPEIASGSRDRNMNNDPEAEDPITKTLNRGLGFVKAASSRMLTRHDSSGTISSDSDSRRAGINSFPPRPQIVEDDWDDDLDDARPYFNEVGDGMADSFFLIPSKSEAPLAILKKENAALKAQIEAQQAKLAAAERMMKQRQEQDQHLRDSIMLARKEAQRAMSSSMALRPAQTPALGAPNAAIPPAIPSTIVTPPAPIPDIASININVPSAAAVSPGRDREAQLLRRIRELEDENRTVRVENEKQKAMIVKFRDRWEKLKESAKRKKEAKAVAETTSVVNDRIDEEPEAEAAAEQADC
ncbi:hypothetical protein BDY19DRAFT_987710 [Irpex rosettiformis]|uniref:Uncharacterized protein n=1 Tax=Irpex rosettiformis TaxID=378272 RepID=A0ACB8TQC3_9APHY|nr:hypothetical protein BDY19DRAFT_987710 [Irpex rosettiformis]